MRDSRSTKNTVTIKASPQKIFDAFTDPGILVTWFAPGDMTATISRFNLKVGGGYEMILSYPESEKETKGKFSDKEDRYTSRFLEILPGKRLVQSIRFDSDDPSFSGEMIMEVSLIPAGENTTVIIVFKNIPAGIKPEDNEEGTQLSLEKLARLVQ